MLVVVALVSLVVVPPALWPLAAVPAVLLALRHRLGTTAATAAWRWLALLPVATLAFRLPSGGLALGAAVVVLIFTVAMAASGPARMLAALYVPVGDDGLDRFGWLIGQSSIALGLMLPAVAGAALVQRAVGGVETSVTASVTALAGGALPVLAIIAGEVILAGAGPWGRFGGLVGLAVAAGGTVVTAAVVLTGESLGSAPTAVAVLAGLAAAALAFSLWREAAPRTVPGSGATNLGVAAPGAVAVSLLGSVAAIVSAVAAGVILAGAMVWLAQAWGRAVTQAVSASAHSHEGGCSSHDHGTGRDDGQEATGAGASGPASARVDPAAAPETRP